MTNTEIAALLCSYRAAKNAAKDLRTEMMRVVTEQFGLDQDEARQTSLETFLDGYLVGQGMVQPWRKKSGVE